MCEVAVLFARADSIYKTLPGCDVWDAERDALQWPGGAPVIAHPPCRAWGDVYKCPQVTHDAKRRTVTRVKRAAPHWHGERAGSVYVSVDGGPRLRRSVIRIRNDHGRALHPTQKPVDLLDLLIRYSVPPGGVIVDPFLGSGSTALSAQRTGRHWIGVEIDPRCEAMQIERLKQLALVLEAA